MHLQGLKIIISLKKNYMEFQVLKNFFSNISSNTTWAVCSINLMDSSHKTIKALLKVTLWLWK